MIGRNFAKSRSPALSQMLPTDYANHVRQIEVGFGPHREAVCGLHLPGAFARVFPALTKMSMEIALECVGAEWQSWHDPAADMLPAYINPKARAESIRQRLMEYVESLIFNSDRQFLINFSFNTLDATTDCSDCGHWDNYYSMIVSLEHHICWRF